MQVLIVDLLNGGGQSVISSPTPDTPAHYAVRKSKVDTTRRSALDIWLRNLAVLLRRFGCPRNASRLWNRLRRR
jgi:hypothetical protein